MFASGKLLLTGEYFVLDGALALAIPVRFGQRMEVVPGTAKDELHWRSLNEKGEEWFSGSWLNQNGQAVLRNASDAEVRERLQQLFTAVLGQRSNGLATLFGTNVTTQVDFPREWGLGTSSTLVSLLAQQTNTNPYQLLAATFGGSGYDIACAAATTPILYQRLADDEVVVSEAEWQANYQDQIYFAYQGQKQNSREGIRHYRELGGTQPTLIDQVTELTKSFLQAQQLAEAQDILREHEAFISNVLQMETVQDQRFADFPGAVKSLGAWGGDFVMILSDWPAEQVRHYFLERDCPIVLAYAEMVR
ncbi:MAG: GYDIA family GHMP kinase [Bacteroidota bacterium]